MSWISKSPYLAMDKSILCEELLSFKAIISTFNKNTPFYVYAICGPEGLPIYIGKGKNRRAFDHLKV
jgi:hypothetical protein